MVGGEFSGVFVKNFGDNFLFIDEGENDGLKCAGDIIAEDIILGGHVKLGYQSQNSRSSSNYGGKSRGNWGHCCRCGG